MTPSFQYTVLLDIERRVCSKFDDELHLTQFECLDELSSGAAVISERGVEDWTQRDVMQLSRPVQCT